MPALGNALVAEPQIPRMAPAPAGLPAQVNLPSARFICAGSMRPVSRGFHAVTKAPVRAAYLPCSKTREGVYPRRKIEKKKKGEEGGSVAVDLGPPPVLCSQCAIRENSHRCLPFPLPGCVASKRERWAGGGLAAG